MSNVASTVTSIRWTAICPWLILVRAARVSLMVRVIVLALVGVIVTELGWSLVDRVVFDGSAAKSPLVTLEAAASAAESNYEVGGRVIVNRVALSGPLLRGWRWASQPFLQLSEASTWRSCFGLLLDGLWAIAVWALFGGAIARIAALYLTRGETIGPLAALKAALARWPSTAGAPAFAVLSVLLASLPLVFAGWLMRLDIFALLIGVLWIVVLIGGLAIAVLAIGAAVGWPLMVSTVAIERTDAFDGISRGYAYVYQRPLHLLFFFVVAALLGTLAQAAVNLIVESSLDATRWAIGVGAGEVRTEQLYHTASTADRNSLGNVGGAGRDAIALWSLAFHGFAVAFPMAYLFPAATGIYLLMRRQIDAADLGDVTFDEGDPQRGLPTLVKDPITGVPHIVGVDPAATVPPTPAP